MKSIEKGEKNEITRKRGGGRMKLVEEGEKNEWRQKLLNS